ncbi:Transcriptional regulator, TetR family [[Actinomadura] parvosata subsp. kistnae]|uniref:TetR family transcriptional regulator n=1 Tax=[Actinomadura] parvosata subsp. kistnae TaxID=1909395 RepID=A0A1U9ZU33_9ACTN|nr:TetR/AcrR family transcriptional regulator [Nonomuraea sp. ATCC 55076]AQZ61444.1 TetR family transcriptional regulator [Nonomuraea sp. ATCC 55076]SPL98140.1 Transcriptional regulator, TetR family [Actinomadura parvosata subsp. kistnae]
MDRETTTRPLRADARRNRDRLVAEARAAFDRDGVAASLEDVAARAGVGIGTLYRHFPTREALLEEVLRERFDALGATARALLDHASPRAALRTWARGFAEAGTTFRGLTAALSATLRDESSALHASCASMRAAGQALLARAQRHGDIRADLTVAELTTMVFGVAWAHEQSPPQAPADLDRLLDLLFDGLSPR